MIDGAMLPQPALRSTTNRLPALLHSDEHGFVVCFRQTPLNVLVRR